MTLQPQPDRLPLVVGLTTLPSRIDRLRPTLDSLRVQTRPPDRILLNLPRWSRRENCAYPTPDWLQDCAPQLEVVACDDDWGPGTKLLGCLDHLPEPSCLVIVDDDMAYRPQFLQGLYDSQIADRGSSFSYYTFPCGAIDIGQGADGFSFYTPNLGGIRAFAARALKGARLSIVDDLWISAYLKSRGIAVRSIKHLLQHETTVYDATHSVNQLHDLAGDLDREVLMRDGSRWLLEHGMLGRRLQATALLKKVLRKVRPE